MAKKPKDKPKIKVDRSAWCMSCDLGHHHPGRSVDGCKCGCGSR